MNNLLDVYARLLPLVFLAILGFVLAHYGKIQAKPLAKLFIFCLSPLLIVGGIGTLKFNDTTIVVPVITFILCSLFGYLGKAISSRIVSNRDACLIGFGCGVPNTGAFGLPVVLALLGDKSFSLQMLILFGVGFTSYTTAFFMLARGSFTIKESLQRLFSMPFLYVASLAIIISAYQIPLPAFYESVYTASKGALTVTSMLVLGASFYEVLEFKCNWNVIGTLIGLRFILWPLLLFGLVVLLPADWVSRELKAVLLCNMFIPAGLNMVNMSLIFDLDQGNAAWGVAMSTVVGMALMPLALLVV